MITLYAVRDTQNHITELFDEKFVISALTDMGYSPSEVKTILDLALQGNRVVLSDDDFTITFWGVANR